MCSVSPRPWISRQRSLKATQRYFGGVGQDAVKESTFKFSMSPPPALEAAPSMDYCSQDMKSYLLGHFKDRLAESFYDDN